MPPKPTQRPRNMIMQDTPVSLYKRAFPKAYLGPMYRDLLTRHVTDLDLWGQVLADARSDRQRVRVPWLIQQYQRHEQTIREIETPPDRLTTHRDALVDRPVHQGKVDLSEIYRIMQDEARKTREARA